LTDLQKKIYFTSVPAVLLEVLLEEARRLHVDAHRGEHNGEVVVMVVEDTKEVDEEAK
jgi:hypothetical protein